MFIQKFFTILALFLSISLNSFADSSKANNPSNYPVAKRIESIPLPPVGQRWVINEMLSDEFDGIELDSTKWFDHHPRWIGRAPGLFMPSQVKLSRGYLKLTGAKMDKPIISKKYGKSETYDVAVAAVISKMKGKYGYYECRFKANKTTLSSTFWMSTGENYSTEGRQPEGAESGTFGQELDFCECIGRNGNFDGSKFADGMHSNVHYWFSGKEGREDIRAQEVKLCRSDGKKPSEGYNIYGCWWKDKETAIFYLNNEQSAETKFIAKKTKKPFYFTEPMSINLVTETYPFPWISLPDDSELADPSKCTTSYDWVRSYILVPLEESVEYTSAHKLYKTRVNFATTPIELEKATFDIAYTSDKDRTLLLELYNSDDKCIAKKMIDVYAGYGHGVFELDAKLIKGQKYHMVAHILPRGDLNGSSSYSTDSFEFTASK